MNHQNNKQNLRIESDSMYETRLPIKTTAEMKQQQATLLPIAVSVVSSLYLSVLSQVWTTVIYACESTSQTWLTWLRIDEDLGKVWIDDRQVRLTKKEYKLVIFLQKKAGKVCTKDELISEIWPEVFDTSGVNSISGMSQECD